MKDKKQMDRRSFLKLAGAAGVAAAMPLVSPSIGLASLTGGLKVAQETRIMMGTMVAVTVVDQSAAKAQTALNRAYEAISAIAPTFDRYHSGGALYELNSTGSLSKLPPALSQVLELCAKVNQSSGGAFDISVAPIVDAYKNSFAANKSLPEAKQLEKAMSAIGGFSLANGTARLTKEGAAVTLDGVAKGYIVDIGMTALKRAGVSHALINAGGDVAAMGNRADGKVWRVGVADPADKTQAKQVMHLSNAAVATSGNYEIYFDQEKLFHHIIDPHTGASPKTEASVSVKASSATVADALSTACFVMEPGQAMNYLNSHAGVEGLMLTRFGQKFMTTGFAG